MRLISLTIALILAWQMVVPICAKASPKTPVSVKLEQSIKLPELKGWGFVVSKLENSGLERDFLEAVFNDPRMPPHTPIPFKLKPVEPGHIYTSFTYNKRLAVGRDCLAKNNSAFVQAEKKFGVSKEVIAAILLVETLCGQNTGKELVLHRLARLGSINETGNVQFNYKNLKKSDPQVKLADVAARADYLDLKFFPELPAFFQVIQKKTISPFDLRGSSAGAFGMAQFLPSSYLLYAIDGNANKITSLFEEVDAIHSIANYLASFGWQESADISDKRKVIWRYNQSDAYVDTVIKVSILLGVDSKGAYAKIKAVQ